ncbi:hypothetical protein B0H17DRAFT_1208497 [Mycena rosella]|uniref:Uncharacterized protein n=1 Tax=Mycena rosella TaxID=1033263 RepID=A0AAD7GB61_MYCRO|nr:hypothetical protein B0H17DRAFT_1208497 [Mycena rosella]
MRSVDSHHDQSVLRCTSRSAPEYCAARVQLPLTNTPPARALYPERFCGALCAPFRLTDSLQSCTRTRVPGGSRVRLAYTFLRGAHTRAMHGRGTAHRRQHELRTLRAIAARPANPSQRAQGRGVVHSTQPKPQLLSPASTSF